MRNMKEDQTGKTNRGGQIMRGILGITLATSFMVAPLTFGRPVSGTSLISLGESLAPLQAQFNAAADKPRVVTILSPT